MNIRKIYKLNKEMECREHRQKMRKYDKEKKIETKHILEEMLDNGFELIYQNGYSFDFKKNGIVVDFVNQTSRFCCSFYKEPQDEIDTDIIRDMHSILRDGNHSYSTRERKEIKEEYKYNEKIFNGSYISATEDMIEFFEENYGKVV